MNIQAILAILCLCFSSANVAAQEPEAKESIQFKVETLNGHYRNSDPIPHIGFEVLPMGQGPFAKPLYAGTTDANGVATVSLPAEFAGEKHPNVIVRVKESGKAQSHGRWEKGVYGAFMSRPASQLFPRDGWTCYWQIQDASGAAIDADFAWKFSVQGLKGRPRNGARDLLRDRELGTGWVSANSTGSDAIDFWAWKLGVGSIVHEGVKPRDIGRDGGPLKLQKGSTLRGKIQGNGGRVIAHIDLFVRRTGSDWLPWSIFDSPSVELGTSVTERGLRIGQCTTDREGHFELEGLEPGDYELLVYAGSSTSQEWLPVGPKSISTESEEPILHFGQPAIQVRLFISDGSPWSGQHKKRELDSFSFAWERGGGLHRWPATPQLIVRELTPGDLGGLKNWRGKDVHWIPPNAMISTIRHGKTYAVQVIGGGFTGQVHRFVAGAAGAPTSIDVTEIPAATPGKLIVTPKRRDFTLGEDMYDSEFGLWIADLESGLPLISRGRFEAGPSEFSLPPGKYRLVLEGRPLIDTHHGSLLTRRRAGRVEQIVQVQSGVEQSIDLSMNSGGRILLTVDGQARPEDKEAIKQRFPNSDIDTPRFAPMYESATVEIRALRFLTEPVQYSTMDAEDTSSFGRHLQDRWPLGKTEKSEVLPTGTYQLISTMPGGRTTSTQITIEENKTLEVTLKIPVE